MDRDRLQGWLQIASNVGLLVGLVLVGLQIKQASDLTYQTLLVSAFQQETDHFNAVMGEGAATALARAKTDPQALTAGDIEVLVAYSEWRFSMMRRNAALEAEGMSSPAWRELLPVLGADLGSNPVTRQYLLESGDSIEQVLGGAWQTVMQDAARETPPDSGKRSIERMLRAANAGAPPASGEAPTPAREP
jgi:hypothetical protein